MAAEKLVKLRDENIRACEARTQNVEGRGLDRRRGVT